MKRRELGASLIDRLDRLQQETVDKIALIILHRDLMEIVKNEKLHIKLNVMK